MCQTYHQILCFPQRCHTLTTWAGRCVLVTLLLAGGKVGQAQDSLGMHCLSDLDYWSTFEKIQMVGNLAYVASGASGLHIMSLADPINPVEIGRFTCNQWDGVNGVYVLGSRAYIAAYNSGFVLDISNPTTPVTLGQWESPQNVRDISFVHEDYAVAQGGEEEPYVLDISDPTNVHQIGEFSVSMRGVGMAGEYLCMTGCPGGLVLYDMSNPAYPQWVASVDTALLTHYATISGNYGYVAALYNGLRIIDLSNPLQPVEVAVCDTSNWTEDVTVTGSYAVLLKGSSSSSWINIWNIADPTQPVFVSEFHSQEIGSSLISSSGNLVCTQSNGSGYNMVTTVDISDPAVPVVTSSFGPWGLLTRMAISDTIVFLADRGTQLRTVDITNSYNISELAHMNASVGEEGLDIAVRRDYAYVVEQLDAGGTMGVVAYDISNPAELDSLGYVVYEGAGRIVIEGDYAYVARLYHIATFSLTNPALPQCVDVLDLPSAGPGIGFVALNGYLYYASGGNFYVCSLADPAAPVIAGSCNLGGDGEVCDLAVAGSYACVAKGSAGLRIVNVALPAYPIEVNSIYGYIMSSVARAGNLAIVDDGNYFCIYDITDPWIPNLIGYYVTNEYITDMEIQGQYLYTTSISDFRVYQCDALTNVIEPSEPIPTKFNLLPPYPNPFNSQLTIPFTIPVQKEVIINIYNVLGQKVKEFTLPSQTPGMHRVIWNPEECASGIYLVRMTANGQECKRKVVLLK